MSIETPVRGWTLLSKNQADDLAVIAAARDYGINHLQLSHEIIHELRTARNRTAAKPVNRLIDAAHSNGISEVVVWDHILYNLEHYPWRFRTGPDATIDLDNPKFWEWFKMDYRRMLDALPNVDGVVLTFIESDARIEQQYSTKLKTRQEKIAAAVDAVADVVIGERHLNLYARTFAYTYEEYDNIIGAVALFKNPDIRIMMKETPHDFFLTHPNDLYAGTIPRPTIIEFDAAGEYNGQGIIADTWPQYMLDRWRDLGHRPHVIGYVARTDRYGDTRLVGEPGEIDLLALKRAVEDPDISAEQVYDEFITAHYGAAAIPQLKPAFKNAFDIVSSSLYTLGTVVSSHSALNYDPYSSSYVRMVSGKWLDPPTVRVDHGVDCEFHYWKDVINHIAPAFVKASIDPKPPATKSASAPAMSAKSQLRTSMPRLKIGKPASRPAPVTRWDEVPDIRKSGWITPGEAMDEQYLRYIVTEKDYGVRLAEESLQHVENARPVLTDAAYQQLHHYFERTLLTARLHRAVASAYFGFRVWARGEGFQTDYVTNTTRNGLDEIRQVSALIRNYPVKPPKGQWDWLEDPKMAETYFNWITRGTWPKRTEGVVNPQAGVVFPYEQAAAGAD